MKILILLLSSVAFAQPWSGVLATTRATDWTQAGISGGIPSGSWSQCVNTQCATVTSAGTSATAAQIVAAMTNAPSNTYVKLAAGTYNFSSGIIVSGANNVELRGAGPLSTHLVFTGSSTCAGGIGSCALGIESTDTTYSGGSPTAYNWTAGYSAGATSITLASSTGIVVGTMLVLDQCDTGYSGTPCTGTSVDNGNYFVAGDAFNPTGNGSQTVTVTGGTTVTGTGFTTSLGNTILLTIAGAPTAYQFTYVNSTTLTLATSVSNTSYTASFPTGASYNAPVGAGRPHRYQQEMTQVVSCSPSCNNSGSTVITISHPLIHQNWASGLSPQAWYIQPSQNVGVTNLSIDGASETYSGDTAGIGFNNMANYWVKNVSMTNFPNITLWMVQSMNGDMESNYIYNSGQSSSSTDNSAINFYGGANLIANNLMHNAHLGIILNGPGSGNVAEANFIANSYTGNGTLFGGIWPNHSEGADYNLWEGNIVPLFDVDNAHGTGLMQTLYRNFFPGWESCANGNCGSSSQKGADLFGVLITAFGRYGNYLGNVLGTPSVHTLGYTYTNIEYFLNNNNGYPWSLGSGNTTSPGSGGTAGGPLPIDNLVLTTGMRWGNYDTYNAATQWNTGEVPSGISVYPNSVPTSSCTSLLSCPASFYLSTRPSWWSSSIPFPAIGPDVSGGNVGQCTGTLNTSGEYAGVAATSSAQCTGTSLQTAWGGHINAIPAMVCALSLGMPPDGTGSALSFDANACYAQPGGAIAGGTGKRGGTATGQ